MAPQTELIDETGRVVFRGTQSPGGGSIPQIPRIVKLGHVEFSDLPDPGMGDPPTTFDLDYAPTAGDVVIAWWPDLTTAVAFDGSAGIVIGQHVNDFSDSNYWGFVFSGTPGFFKDSAFAASGGTNTYFAGFGTSGQGVGPIPFVDASPVQVQLGDGSGLAAGAMDIYALVGTPPA